MELLTELGSEQMAKWTLDRYLMYEWMHRPK